MAISFGWRQSTVIASLAILMALLFVNLNGPSQNLGPEKTLFDDRDEVALALLQTKAAKVQGVANATRDHTACTDNSTSCAAWAGAGYCLTNDFTKDNCPKSCGLCPCVDESTSCAAWAGAGYCLTNDFTKDNCPKSCGLCPCVDNSTSCAAWAGAGYCTTNDYTRDQCPMSCGSCPQTKAAKVQFIANATRDHTACTDNSTSCAAWAGAGYCLTNDFTKDNCPKSCGLCPCVDDSTSCAAWAGAGYCTTNDYTKDHCPKSCGLCPCVDNSTSCAAWAGAGYCTTNDYTRDQCPKSCGSC